MCTILALRNEKERLPVVMRVLCSIVFYTLMATHFTGKNSRQLIARYTRVAHKQQNKN
jgi:hypothetical protein